MNRFPFDKTAMLGKKISYEEVTVTASIRLKVPVPLTKSSIVDITTDTVVFEPKIISYFL